MIIRSIEDARRNLEEVLTTPSKPTPEELEAAKSAIERQRRIASDYLLCHREKLVSAMAKELEKSEAYRGNFIKAALWAGRMFDAMQTAVEG